jgi:monofunctional biosynthetic peptidoglycan transglycosylase
MSRARAWLGRLLRWAVIAAVGLPLFSVAQVVAVRWVDPPLTATMAQRWVEGGFDGAGWSWVKVDAVSLDAMGPVPVAAVSSEDARFFVHSGFDWQGICAAAKANRDGASLRGGSTISQQVARNVFLIQRRSWVRKGLEAWYTVWLELLVPKERILELYLNVAETGPKVFGFEAAAQHWYKKPASALSSSEAARLVALLPAPRSREPSGSSSTSKVKWLARNRVPFPGDPGFEELEAAWEKAPWPWQCFQ